MLVKGGTAVDAAIATMICSGTVNLHSTGIGGGGFMVVYNKKNKSAKTFNFRETAPAGASQNMFVADRTKSKLGKSFRLITLSNCDRVHLDCKLLRRNALP